jgi:hypothetical protein
MGAHRVLAFIIDSDTASTIVLDQIVMTRFDHLKQFAFWPVIATNKCTCTLQGIIEDFKLC